MLHQMNTTLLRLQESEILKTRKESYQEKLEEYNARLKEVQLRQKRFFFSHVGPIFFGG